jgi:hypothetical protein
VRTRRAVVVRGSNKDIAGRSCRGSAKARFSMIVTGIAVLVLLACAAIEVTLRALPPTQSLAQTLPATRE